MAGIPGAGGPVPKRQRRHKGAPALASTKAPADPGKVVAPEPDDAWHPVARRWFESLAESGQAAFYGPSDWGTAWLLAESISRELSPQPLVVKGGEVEMVLLPPKAASIAAWLKGCTALMATEGDRRRLRLELDRVAPAAGPDPSSVAHLAEFRRRLECPPGTGPA